MRLQDRDTKTKTYIVEKVYKSTILEFEQYKIRLHCYARGQQVSFYLLVAWQLWSYTVQSVITHK